jgi:hypothetical protein
MTTMQDGQFYMTLPSNTIIAHHSSSADPTLMDDQSLNFFAKPNQQSDYRVHVPYKMDLPGSWEVGMVEFHCVHSWYNVDGESIIITMRSQEEWNYAVETERVQNANKKIEADNAVITERNKNMSEGQEKLPLQTLHDLPPMPNPAVRPVYIAAIPPGYYDTREQFVRAVDKAISEAFTSTDTRHRIRLEYDSIHHRVTLTIPSSIIYSLTFDPKLQYMLGLNSNYIVVDTTLSQTVVKSQNPIDLRGGFDAMYVYCDIVEPQIVGDCLTPPLRVVKVEGNHDDVLVRTFDFPHYVPVSKREISTIEINIKDDANRFVGFRYGKVVVKLHFRRRKAVM